MMFKYNRLGAFVALFVGDKICNIDKNLECTLMFWAKSAPKFVEVFKYGRNKVFVLVKGHKAAIKRNYNNKKLTLATTPFIM